MSKKPDLFKMIEEVSTADWDEHLEKISREWIVTYHLRQAVAAKVGDKSKPPAPPEMQTIDGEVVPTLRPSQKPRQRLIEKRRYGR